MHRACHWSPRAVDPSVDRAPGSDILLTKQVRDLPKGCRYSKPLYKKSLSTMRCLRHRNYLRQHWPVHRTGTPDAPPSPHERAVITQQRSTYDALRHDMLNTETIPQSSATTQILPVSTDAAPWLQDGFAGTTRFSSRIGSLSPAAQQWFARSRNRRESRRDTYTRVSCHDMHPTDEYRFGSTVLSVLIRGNLLLRAAGA